MARGRNANFDVELSWTNLIPGILSLLSPFESILRSRPIHDSLYHWLAERFSFVRASWRNFLNFS